MISDCFFFGCAHRAGNSRGLGHFWYRPGLTPIWTRDEEFASLPRQVDGHLAPGGSHADRQFQVEGAAKLVDIGEWTAVAFWDRSGDDRYGSNALFILRGNGKTFEEVVQAARTAFPEVWERFTFRVELK